MKMLIRSTVPIMPECAAFDIATSNEAGSKATARDYYRLSILHWKPLLHLYAAIDVDSFLERRSRGNWSGSPRKVVRLAGRSATRYVVGLEADAVEAMHALEQLMQSRRGEN